MVQSSLEARRTKSGLSFQMSLYFSPFSLFTCKRTQPCHGTSLCEALHLQCIA